MKVTTSAMVLAALAMGEASAASMTGHSQKHNHAVRHAEMMQAMNEKRELARRDTNILSAVGTNYLKSIGVTSMGLNNAAASGTIPWLGTGGQYTNEFINESPNEVHLVVWGPAGSWVNAVQPQITVSLAPNAHQIVSFPSGASGAWSVAYDSIKLVNGQISNTWGEYTFGPYGVVDVSREVNMNGINMTVVGPKCVTDMSTCVFKCTDGTNTCKDNYDLFNCANGSQEGANFGHYDGKASGGCGGMGDSAALKTYIGSRT